MRQHQFFSFSFTISAVLKEGGESLDLSKRSLKDMLTTIITITPEEQLVQLIRQIFPTDPMYLPISELVGKNEHTTIRNLQDAGVYLTGQLTCMTLSDLAKIRSFTKDGPRTKFVVEAMKQVGLTLKEEEEYNEFA